MKIEKIYLKSRFFQILTAMNTYFLVNRWLRKYLSKFNFQQTLTNNAFLDIKAISLPLFSKSRAEKVSNVNILDLAQFLLKLCVILSVYNKNSKGEITVNLYKGLCAENYDLLQTSFNNTDTKWINISPTIHMLLAHSWELIAINENCSLGEYEKLGLSTIISFWDFLEFGWHIKHRKRPLFKIAWIGFG